MISSKVNIPLKGIILIWALIGSISSIYAQDKLAEAQKEVADEFRRQMADKKIVGGALVGVQPGKTILQEHYGLANKEKNIHADENTIYCWSSITKTLTCIAIMQLQRKGKININDPLAKYTPSFMNVNKNLPPNFFSAYFSSFQ